MHKSIKYLAFFSTLLAASTAAASGYQLNEYSVNNLGRAFAGVGVVGDDYSAIAFNPAGMTLKNSGLQTGITVVQMHSKTEGTITPPVDLGQGVHPGKIDLYKPLPHFFAQVKANENLYLGFGTYMPFGLASVYDGDWFGASHGIKTELQVVDNAFAAAYKINEQWSLGAAVIYRYVRGDLINALPGSPDSRNEMDLDGWGLAYNFGIMYEPVEDTRFGVAYRLNSAHTVKGDHEIRRYNPAVDGTYDGKSTMTLPNQLTLSAYHKINDKFGVSGAARWTKWDVFDTFVMQSSRTGAVRIPENWDNVWTFSLGLDYYHSPEWTFRLGVSEDPTPVPSADYRTARIPDSDRKWVTVGASYVYDNMHFDVGYAHLFMRTAAINNNDGTSTLDAKAKSYSNMLGLQFQYDF